MGLLLIPKALLLFFGMVVDELCRYMIVEILARSASADPSESMAIAMYTQSLAFLIAHMCSFIGIWIFQRMNTPLMVGLLYNLRTICIIYLFLHGNHGLLIYGVGFVTSAREYLLAESLSTTYRTDPRCRMLDAVGVFFARLFVLIFWQIRNVSALLDPSLRRSYRVTRTINLAKFAIRAGSKERPQTPAQRIIFGTVVLVGIAILAFGVEIFKSMFSKSRRGNAPPAASVAAAPSAPPTPHEDRLLRDDDTFEQVPSYREMVMAARRVHQATDDQERAEAAAELYAICERRDNQIDGRVSSKSFCHPQVIVPSSVVPVGPKTHPLVSICFHVFVHPIFFSLTYITLFLTHSSLLAYTAYGNNTQPLFLMAEARLDGVFRGGFYDAVSQFGVVMVALVMYFVTNPLADRTIFRMYVASAAFVNSAVTLLLAVLMICGIVNTYALTFMCAVSGLLEIGRNAFVYPYNYRRAFDKSTLTTIVNVLLGAVMLPYAVTQQLPVYVPSLILALANGIMVPISLATT